MTYTEKELNQFLHGISLSLLSKKSAQHWRYDEETAKEIEWLEALERKVRADKADRKTENSSEKPNNLTAGVWNAGYKTGYDKGHKDAQKVKDSQDLVKDLVKAFCEDGTCLERQGVYTLTLAEAKQRAVDIIESVTQKETQNSNLTFEKRTMRDCYNCKRYETEDECIECHYEPKTEPNSSEIPNNSKEGE